MSLSSRTSWTLGGGRAIARPMKPITRDGFLDFEVECAGRSFPSSKTTLNENVNCQRFNLDMTLNLMCFYPVSGRLKMATSFSECRLHSDTKCSIEGRLSRQTIHFCMHKRCHRIAHLKEKFNILVHKVILHGKNKDEKVLRNLSLLSSAINYPKKDFFQRSFKLRPENLKICAQFCYHRVLRE